MEKIIQYQELDGKIRKLEMDLKNCEERKRAKSRKTFLAQVDEIADKLDKKAFDLRSKYTDIKSVLENKCKELREFAGVARTLEAHTEVDYNVRKLEKINSEMRGLEKELEDLEKEITQTNNEFGDLRAKNKVAREEYAMYREKYEQKKLDKKPEIDKMAKELKAQEKAIDKEIMKKYNEKKEQKIYPIFVKAINDDMCGGCSMHLPLAAKNKLKISKMIECEECKRYIYID